MTTEDGFRVSQYERLADPVGTSLIESASPDPVESAETPTTSPWRVVREWVVVIGVALVVALVIRGFVVAPFSIPSGSMNPTLYKDDRILVNKLSYHLHNVNRGDVVVFNTPASTGLDPTIKHLVKRVIGLPGEVVQIHDCNVYVDGSRLDEPYTKGVCTSEPPQALGPADPDGDGKVVVPANSVFVMGDNRQPGQSRDSRFWGFVPDDLIVGRAFVIIFPFGHWRWL